MSASLCVAIRHVVDALPVRVHRSAMDVHLQARSVEKSFSEVSVLSGLNLAVGSGELVFLVGGSGSGKTTLLRILAGLDRPDSGSVRVGDSTLTDATEAELARVRRSIGVLFQSAALFDDLTVWDNLELPLREHLVLDEQSRGQRIREHLAVLGLEGSERRLPSELSGGMKKRVGLARALMLEPELMLYDEPTGGLDPTTARRVERLMARICQEDGVTTVAVSHDMASALRLADRICVLADGRVVAEGAPTELMECDVFAEMVEASGVDVEGLLYSSCSERYTRSSDSRRSS